MSQATLLSTSPNTSSLPPIAYKGTPAMTTEMLAQAYGVESVRIRQNFSRNTARFLEGKHFFVISGNELKELKHCVSLSDSVNIPHQTRKLTLWTDRGAARHAKMLETDTAWDVYEMLEDTFFTVKPAPLPQISLDISTTADRKPLEKLVKVWASQEGIPHAQAWTQVNAHFNLGSITELPTHWLPDAISFVEGKIDALPKALPPAQPATPLYVDRLQLTPWDKVQLGKAAVAILERGDKVGPRTLECILLKLRYLDALHDMLKLTNQLAADLDRARKGVFGKIVQAGNVAGGCFTDPIMDILCDDTYHLRKLGDELHTTAFRGLNASICGARMLGV